MYGGIDRIWEAVFEKPCQLGVFDDLFHSGDGRFHGRAGETALIGRYADYREISTFGKRPFGYGQASDRQRARFYKISS
ncbi:hypothetical protein D3C87_1931430 [compost metagenome]